jgi:hypothetical protein
MGSHASGGNTNLRHGHHPDLDMEVGTFINDDTSLTFLGNVERWRIHCRRSHKKQARTGGNRKSRETNRGKDGKGKGKQKLLYRG